MKIYKTFRSWWNSINIKEVGFAHKPSAIAAWDVQQQNVNRYRERLRSVIFELENLIKQLEQAKRLLKEVKKDV